MKNTKLVNEEYCSDVVLERELCAVSFDKELKTQEGTLLIPCTSSLIAKITEITPPRWFSRNARATSL